MAVTLQSNHEVSVAVVSGILDDAEGQKLVSEIMRRVPEGGKLVVDGSQLTQLTPEGAAHLITVQGWTRTLERRRLRIVGFVPAAWQEIVRQRGEWLFDVQKNLAEALASLGVESGLASPPFSATEAIPSASRPPAVTLPRRQEINSPPAPPTSQTAPPAFSAPPPPFAYSVPPPPPPPIASRPPTAMPPPARAGGSRAQRNPGGKPWLALTLIAVVVLALAGSGWWWTQVHRLPVITISAASIKVEEDGKEVDEVTVEVQHGKLVEKSWEGLPRGLYFEPGSDRPSNKAYLLRGKAEYGAKSGSVRLDAASEDGTHSAPVVFTVEVSEKPMTWELNTLRSLGLQVGSPILGESKFVSGATEVSTAETLPPGLRLELTPGTVKDWQLAGTPTLAGIFRLDFKAASSTGKAQEKSCQLEVTPDIPPVTASAPPKPVLPPAPALPSAGTQTAAAPPVRPVAADDGMRKFLLERIEKLPARYTEEDRENLRLVVNDLKQSRLIQRVAFERVGQTEVSDDQAAKLKAVLQSPDVADLLKKPDCQIAIVGYASKGGSLLSNVRISKARARAVDGICKSLLGRDADLCGDYGPTDVVNQSTEEANRVVEVYAGLLDLPVDLRSKAASFRDDFNRRHGAH